MDSESNDDHIAKRIIISEMKVMKVTFDGDRDDMRYELNTELNSNRYYPEYPILIQGSGEPWTLGNLYLLKRLQQHIKYEPNTYKTIADHLLHFLRWIERNNIEPLRFPREPTIKSHFLGA